MHLRSAKQQAILAWFCLTGERRISRQRLADLLWSGSDEEHARGSLRNVLYNMPDLPGGGALLLTDRTLVEAGFAPPVSDVARALSAWDRGEDAALRSVSLVSADLRFAASLTGLDPEFDTFLRQSRERFLTGLAADLRARLTGSQDERSRPVAERLSELVPQDETAARHLMRLDLAAGNPAAALARYDALWAVLDRDFDVEPSTETQALVVAIKMQSGLTPGPGTLPAEPIAGQARLTVYLRPFAGAGLPDETRMVIDGLQAEILAALLAVEDWIVIEAPGGLDLPPHPGGYELRGAFTPGLGEVRILLTLKDLATHQVIWSRPLPMNRPDWIRNSELVVQRLAMRLTGRIEQHYLGRIGSLPDEALVDYDRLIRARWLMNDWTAEADRRAEVLLRSVQSAGELGLRARVGLADLLNSRDLIFPGLGAMRAGVPEAVTLAEACIAEAPDRADAWLALAWGCVQLGRAARAADAAEAVIEASPGNPRRLASATEVLALAGRVDDAAAMSRRIATMDPGINRFTLGFRVSVALLSGDADDCMDLAERANGAIILGFGYAAAAARLAGQPDRARAYWHRFEQDLAARWQHPRPPAARDWFLAATPLRDAAALARLSGALADTGLPPASTARRTTRARISVAPM
ncbi:MAG: BTAD domain-containing putative transcriptional regulator [Gemmobacter sp.]